MPQKGLSITVFLIILAAVVIAAGVLVWQYFKPVPQGQLTTEEQFEEQSAVDQIDETANWKTYRNEEYGFEMQYPKEWRYEEYPAIESMGFDEVPAPEGTGGGSNSVGIRFVMNKQEIFQLLSGLDNVVLEPITIDETQSIKVSGYYKKNGPMDYYVGLKTVRVFIQKDTSYYVISFSEQYKGDLINFNIFNQILSTFRFLDSTEGITEDVDKCAGGFIFPAGGEKFFIGENQEIAWKMPERNTYYNLHIEIVDENDIKIGEILFWNWVSYDPVDSAHWDVKTIYPAKNINIHPGKYKFVLRYLYSGYEGEKTSGKGAFQSNYFMIEEELIGFLE